MEAFGTSPAQHRLVTQKRLASSLVQSFLGSQLRHNAASEQRTLRCKFQVLTTSHLFQHAWILANLALHLWIQTRFWPMNVKISQELNLCDELYNDSCWTQSYGSPSAHSFFLSGLCRMQAAQIMELQHIGHVTKVEGYTEAHLSLQVPRPHNPHISKLLGMFNAFLL